jgi:predicted transposase/invertase (TIGR01784 family)
MNIHHIHDKFFKQSLKEKKIALAFLRAHLPPKLYNRIDPNSLVLTDKSFITAEHREIHSDIIYRCTIDGASAYLFFLIEHESTSNEKYLPLKKLEYCIYAMKDHLKQGHTHLPIIIQICIYHGKESPYPHSTNIYDYFENPRLAREFAFDKSYFLIDLTTLTDEEIKQHDVAALMELLFKHARDRDLLKIFKQARELVHWILEEVGYGYFESVIKYLLRNQKPQKIEKFMGRLIQILPEEKAMIMSIGDALEERGRQKGIKQGNLETARRMLHDGLDKAFIQKFTHLSDEELDKLFEVGSA